MTFEELNLIAPLMQAVKKLGYVTPSPIQEKAIPHVLNGVDVFGCAQTGTGKTAAFSLPILQLIQQKQHSKQQAHIKALVLAPTRELALQIHESFTEYGKGLPIKSTVIFGGVSQLNQTNALKRGVDILIATPGRLIDLMNQGYIDLRHLEFFVLDEVDRMLDMGFIADIKRVIAKIPAKRQTLFFSATVPPDIKKLADSLLKNPVQVHVAPISTAAEMVKQSVYLVEKNDKVHLLKQILLDQKVDHALVFTRTKHGADKVVKDLKKSGISAEAIHGNKSQNARQRALKDFKDRSLKILVATDIASRGIDVDKLSHVFQYDLPEVPETYIHRIGRTGRAGMDGIAISFCASEERDYLKGINKLLKVAIDEGDAGKYQSTVRDYTPSPKVNQARPSSSNRKQFNNARPKRSNHQPNNANKLNN